VSTVSLSFVLDTMRLHTHVRVGFSDYKLLIHAATDNPFLLYYIYMHTSREIDRFSQFKN